MNYYSKNIKDVEKLLRTNIQTGLDNKEANNRLKKDGENTIKDNNKKSNISKFLAQFNDFMVIILLIAGAISFVTSFLQGEKDFLDTIIIVLIVVINAILGFMQENKAEKALEALKKMSSPKANVIRNGALQKVDSTSLVTGDIIVINSGDYISADARLIECSNLKIEEASLTGESTPIEKNTDTINIDNSSIGDRKNMVYSGTLAINGKGKAIVTATGMQTEMGKIAHMIINHQEEQTNLQKKLEETGKILGIGALAICFGIFFIGLFRKIPPFEMFMTSVSLAVAAIPEGLPAIVTIMLAIGVEKMVKKNAIIRKLPAVEALGSATVICSDKTGTLTQNKMEVVKIYTDDKEKLYSMASLCNNVEIGLENKLIGEPTEIALMELAIKNGVYKNEEEKVLPRVDEIAFDSKRKMMSTIHKDKTGYKIITKGAIDVLLDRCSYYYENGKKEELTENKKKEILRENIIMGKDALRVLAICYKDIDKYVDTKSTNIEKNLIFLGMLGLIDPPREETYEAVIKCKEAGIKPVMITGDHIETAKAIGKKIGILRKDGLAITGTELDNISEKELCENIYKYDIFARVSPEHKVRIVKAFKKKGNIVAMTGDGVNDAPALKTADIGCAMGITGTDVAKGASDIILADDNFATIVDAVKEGRAIYENIKKSVHFLLSSNIGEIITILVALLIGFKSPLAAIQLLWINLVTDSLPAIALGIDPPDKSLMKGRIKKSKTGIFTRDRWSRVILEGMMIGCLALLAYAIGTVVFKKEIIGSTMAFATLSISQLIHAFNMKTEKSIFSINLFNNPYLIGSLIIGVVLQVSVIMLPNFSVIFKVIPLNSIQWLVVFILCIMPIVIVEIEKLFTREK
ncbi:calcium-translocating P-type ATPase, PMCA-type [uncultured Tyzzerella sp.]|uniref:calcium-translocating P-type ATPase, PMCA-type n=1 Tax=uncultured Tyzzerella sp. TaxID=2321398 RepID=UPI002943DEF9|nr:calcium-translocating P-type ATPase, PMCA-type [uncultured Tyzzerella sp.]